MCAVIGGTTQGAQQAMSGGRCVTLAMVEIYCEHGCLISEIKFPTTAYGEMLFNIFHITLTSITSWFLAKLNCTEIRKIVSDRC